MNSTNSTVHHFDIRWHFPELKKVASEELLTVGGGLTFKGNYDGAALGAAIGAAAFGFTGVGGFVGGAIGGAIGALLDWLF